MQETAARKLREDDYRQGRDSRHPGAARTAPVHASLDAPKHTRAENGRRTITITGHPVPPRRLPSAEGIHVAGGHATPPRRRPSPAQAQIQARPDRIALWAVLLGLFLVFMAVATANAATL